jgi:hypothetical protein
MFGRAVVILVLFMVIAWMIGGYLRNMRGPRRPRGSRRPR